MHVSLFFLLLAVGTMSLMNVINMGCPRCVSTVSTGLAYIAEVWSVFHWIRHDSRLKGFRIPYDMGLFVYVFWPLALSSYLISSRGWRKFSVCLLAYLFFVVGLTVTGMALAS